MFTDHESESMLLSCFLRFPVSTGGKCVEAGLSSNAFTTEENQLLYRHMLGVWGEGSKIERHLITFGLRKSGILDAVGGIHRINGLNELSPTEHIIPMLITRLLDSQKRREIIAVAKRAYEDAQGSRATHEILSDLGRLGERSGENVEVLTAGKLNRALVDRAMNPRLISTGFNAIDKGCGRVGEGDFLVVGGGAKAGKSTLAGCIAKNIAWNRWTVIFTIEMNGVEYWRRLVNAEAGIPASYWDDSVTALNGQEQRAIAAINRMEKMKILIIDSVMDIEQVFSMCRALKATHGDLGCVVIDYLQQFSTSENTNSRAEAVASISRQCKRGAIGLSALVIGLSQLNDDGKSLDSRGIQRDANLMLNVMSDDDGNRIVTCAFNRNGPMGHQLPIKAEMHYNRFVDAE